MSYTFEPPPESTSPIDFEFKSIFFLLVSKFFFACLKVVLSSLKQLILLTLTKQKKSQLQKHCLTVIRISNTGN
jgi:hypothetical protein